MNVANTEKHWKLWC